MVPLDFRSSRIFFALSQALPSVSAMIGRNETLKRGVRPNGWVIRRNWAMRSAVSASGSPNIAKASQCCAPISIAPGEEPPKNSGG